MRTISKRHLHAVSWPNIVEDKIKGNMSQPISNQVLDGVVDEVWSLVDLHVMNNVQLQLRFPSQFGDA